MNHVLPLSCLHPSVQPSVCPSVLMRLPFTFISGIFVQHERLLKKLFKCRLWLSFSRSNWVWCFKFGRQSSSTVFRSFRVSSWSWGQMLAQMDNDIGKQQRYRCSPHCQKGPRGHSVFNFDLISVNFFFCFGTLFNLFGKCNTFSSALIYILFGLNSFGQIVLSI